MRCVRERVPSSVAGKSRQCHDPEFDEERAWIVEYLAQKDKTMVEHDAKDNDDHEECEDGIECGCCFSKFAFVSPHGIYI